MNETEYRENTSVKPQHPLLGFTQWTHVQQIVSNLKQTNDGCAAQFKKIKFNAFIKAKRLHKNFG